MQFLIWLIPAFHQSNVLSYYLPLHTFLETASIIVCIMAFSVGWRIHDRNLPSNVVLLACSLLAVGALDFLHMISYVGMPDFISHNDSQKHLYFWLSARLLASVALLAVGLKPWSKWLSNNRHNLFLTAMILLVVLITWMVLRHQDRLPDMFIPDLGLTSLKKNLEYAVIGINLLTSGLFLVKVRKPQLYNVYLLFAATTTMAMSEFFFTLYTTMTGTYNVMGHIYKVIGYLYIYRAIVVEVIEAPYNALRDSESRFHNILEHAPIGMAINDVNGRFIWVNPAICAMLKYTPDELKTMSFHDITHPEDLTLTDHLRQKLQNGEMTSYQVEKRYLSKDGQIVWGFLTSSILEDRGGDPIFIAQVKNITERKHMEEQLRASEERYRATYEQAAVGIVQTSFDGPILDCNPRFAQIIGYPLDQVKGMTYQQITDTQDVSEHVLHVQRLRAGEIDTVIWEKRLIRKNGSRTWVKMTLSCLKEEDGTPRNLISVVEDINAQHDLQDKLFSTNAELEQFAYVASHDLRQPLRMVSSYLSLIEKSLSDVLTEDTKKYLAFAVGGAKRMDRMITDLLEYSRTGRSSETENVELTKVIEEALINLSVAIAAADADIHMDQTLPVVHGNPSDFLRLFQNLIGNAIKYRHPDRPIKIEVGTGVNDTGSLVWVKDNGIGIAAKDYDRAFNIFQRLVPQDSHEGSGIGLAIVKKIVDHYGGKIWIESEVGIGSTFFMTFPTAKV